jgi:hypothetical protein
LADYFIFEYKGTTATNTKTVYGEYIIGYGYQSNCGTSTTTFENPKNSDGLVVYNEGVAKLYNVSLPSGTSCYPGAFIGVKTANVPDENKSWDVFQSSGQMAGNSGEKISDCDGGFSYWYKGAEHRFMLEYNDNQSCSEDNKWAVNQSSASSWTQVNVELSSFGYANASWGEANCHNSSNSNNSSVDLSRVIQIAWGTETAGSGYNLMIANVVCHTTSSGSSINSSSPSADIGFALVGLSSSAGSSSSTGGGGSSSSTGGGLSSSTGGGGSSSSTGAGGFTCKLTATYCTTTSTIKECTDHGGNVVDNCDDDVPIINISSVAGTAGLKVVAHNSNLHIYSAKESTVQLYDMRGELVSNWKIQAGENILNLKNQKKGIYYAVVSSGSYKQNVKVAVM